MQQFNGITIKPIGGLGQIGANSFYIESNKSSLLIDAGILFPKDDQFSLNYLIPDYNSFDINPKHILFTHGHEDHIGAFKHVNDLFPAAKVYGSKFVQQLLKSKTKSDYIFQTIIPRETLFFDDIEVTPFHVNHSIPETMGLHIVHRDSSTSLLYISDFKIDHNSLYEDKFDFDYLNSIPSFNNKFFFADSTNILSSLVRTPSEADLLNDLEQLLLQDYRYLFLTTFSSNIWRIKSVLNLAKNHKIPVLFYGGSLLKYTQIAQDCDHLSQEDLSPVRSVEEILNLKTKSIIICSGCQGDFKSTARRVALGEDKNFQPSELDYFVFSSKTIPGNERSVTEMVNKLSLSQTNVVTANDCLIHASGHPGKEDLLEVFKAYKPTCIIPIHGESYFLKRHSEFIKNKGIDFLTMKNGDVIQVANDTSEIEVKNDCDIPEYLLIHGSGIEITRDEIRERRKISQNGAIFISIFSKAKHRSFAFSIIGIPNNPSQNVDINNLVEDFLNKSSSLKEEQLRVDLRRLLNIYLGYKPQIFIHTK